MKNKGLLGFAGISCLFMTAAMLQAGEIVPALDDSTALGDYTAAKAGVANEVADITTGIITLAARFNPDISQAAAGPVIVIEDGGTSNGTGLYIAEGNLIFAAKGRNATLTQPASMNDADYTDGCVLLTLGPVQYGVENNVYASFSLGAGKVYSSVNGSAKIFNITGAVGGENIDGNRTVSFLGSGTIILDTGGAGSLGGLVSFEVASPVFPKVSASNAVNMVQTAGYNNQRGQVFNALAIPPQLPTNPNPADNAVNVDPASVTSLSFTPGQDPLNPGNNNPAVTGYYVTIYDSWNGEPNYAAPLLLDTLLPVAAAPVSVNYTFGLDDTICWQVEEKVGAALKGDPNNIVGPLWSFDSLPSIPVVTAGPVGGLVEVGDNFTLAVDVATITPESYIWYFSQDTIVGDDTVIGTDSPEYTITSATVDDQGYYYCSVVNGSGQPVISPFALVEVAQLVAHYSFDVTDPLDPSAVVDSSDCGNNGIALFYNGTTEESSTVNYGTGFVGNGLLLGSGQMKHVQIPCSVRNSYTISAWVNTSMTAGTGDWWNGAGIVDGEMSGFVSDFGLALTGPRFAMGSGPSGTTTRSVKVINDGQWHFVVATRDITEGEMKVYVDGHREALAVNDIGSVYSTTDVLNIGKIRFENIAAKYFVGTIDEVKMYNYVIDEVAIADSYLSAVPGSDSICIESKRPEAAYDLNGDCEVNIADFALLATKWLDCGLFPDCVE